MSDYFNKKKIEFKSHVTEFLKTAQISNKLCRSAE